MSRRSVVTPEALSPSELQMASAADPRQLVVIEEAQPAGNAAPAERISKPRASVLEEARGWLRTPYHHMGRVKDAGTDCLMLLAEVYESAKVVPHIDVPFYPPDWNLHRDAERYLLGVTRYAREIAVPPQPGDIALFKFGRCFAHGAIVLAWPRLIHAWHSTGVVYGDATQPPLAGRPVRFFDPFATLTSDC